MELTQEEVSERIEHRDAVLDVRAIYSTLSGRRFLKYLLKNFEVATLPPQGLEGSLLFEALGFLRAGKSIWELMAEADPTMAGQLLSEVEKERYAKLYAENSKS